jgi:hypothetical protein
MKTPEEITKNKILFIIITYKKKCFLKAHITKPIYPVIKGIQALFAKIIFSTPT